MENLMTFNPRKSALIVAGAIALIIGIPATKIILQEENDPLRNYPLFKKALKNVPLSAGAEFKVFGTGKSSDELVGGEETLAVVTFPMNLPNGVHYNRQIKLKLTLGSIIKIGFNPIIPVQDGKKYETYIDKYKDNELESRKAPIAKAYGIDTETAKALIQGDKAQCDWNDKFTDRYITLYRQERDMKQQPFWAQFRNDPMQAVRNKFIHPDPK